MPVLAPSFPVFQPAMRIITDITNAFPAIVTTSFDHQYADGLTIRLIIPPGFGMKQANQKFGEIIVLSSMTFSISIDTTEFDTFSSPTAFPYNSQYAQAVPFAEDNSILTQAVRNVLPYSAT